MKAHKQFDLNLKHKMFSESQGSSLRTNQPLIKESLISKNLIDLADEIDLAVAEIEQNLNSGYAELKALMIMQQFKLAFVAG